MNANYMTLFFTILPALVGFTAIILSIYWGFNKEAKERHRRQIKEQLDKLSPSDPEYNDVRNLYITTTIDAATFENMSASSDSNYSCDPDSNISCDQSSSE